MSKVAASDGYATEVIQPAVGDPIEVRRRIVEGSVVPDWLAESADVELKDEDEPSPLKHEVYTAGGEVDKPRDADKEEPTLVPGTDEWQAAEDQRFADEQEAREQPPAEEGDELAEPEEVPPEHRAPAKRTTAKKADK
jgi:hypothetical protein